MQKEKTNDNTDGSINVSKEKKRVRSDDIRVLPVTITKKLALEDCRRMLFCIAGEWFEYATLNKLFVMIYKDTKVLAIITHENQWVETNANVINELYEQIINCFYSSLHSYSLHYGSRTVLLGAAHDRFNNILLYTEYDGEIPKLGVEFSVPQYKEKGEPALFSFDFSCETIGLEDFLFVLCQYVNDHANRPAKAVKQ